MQTFQLDISIKTELQPVIAKQGDIGRKILLEISDNGVPFSIPEGAILSVWYSGTSGEGNYSMIGDNCAFSVSGNAVTVELITQMLTNKGGGILCLLLNSSAGTQIGLWDIPYLVEGVPGMNSDGAQQYYTALSEYAANAIQSSMEVQQAVASFKTDPTFSVSGKAADAAATGLALSQKAPLKFIYENRNGGDADLIVEDDHRFVINFSNTPYAHGFLDTIVADCSGFTLTEGQNIVLQEMSAWNGVNQARRLSLDGGTTWRDWEYEGLRIRPVGTIYMSVNTESPAALFGGTWEQITDVFLFAAGSTYAAGTTGGEEKHVLTVNELPSEIKVPYGTNGGSSGVVNMETVFTQGAVHGYVTLSTGAGNSHNNMPPYLAVYMWKRVA